MTWVSYRVEVPREQAEAAEDALLAAGAQSVSTSGRSDEPLLEPAPGKTPLWRRVRLAGLFSGDADPDAVRLRLAAALGDAGLDVDRVEIADRDWHRAWRERLEPMRFGKRLWVLPESCRLPGDAEAEAVTLRLDPGLAFGTGTHPTTTLCLGWLDAHPPAGLTVVDFGCGSGILGLAAARLGASTVWCTDHDPQAIRAARDNAARNALKDRVRIVEPGELDVRGVDLLLANILLRPLLALAPRFAALLRVGGRAVLSGVTPTQVTSLERRYESAFGEFDVASRDGWARMAAQRLD